MTVIFVVLKDMHTNVQVLSLHLRSRFHAFFVLFTTLHGMQTRSSDENSVRPSVRLYVTRVYCDKTVKRSVQIYIPYERTFSLVF